ncbi:MAG TPA: hypothetical protein VFC76_05735 [Oscillospiraceae bacterium]|nr:hypothetical protein [Oscillospiraceae bacterium]
MIFTFPNFGSLSILLSVLMHEWGVPFVMPPKTTKNTVLLGSRYAPADACLPLKIILGNFLEAAEKGANTAVFLGGSGPCLFGCFSQMIELSFIENSIPINMLRIEPTKDGLKEMLSLIKRVSNKSLSQIAAPIFDAAKSCHMLDKLENRLLLVRSTIENEADRKNFNTFEECVYDLLSSAKSFNELLTIIDISYEKADRYMGGRQNVLAVGIVGDIYTTIDSDANFNLQKQLADMGAYSERSLTITKWFKDKLILSPFGWRWYSKPHIPKGIGGFARQTVGYAAMWSDTVDGIIQVHPLNCMPEVAAATILSNMSSEQNFPFLSLVLDELSGESGYVTRIEAFYDLLEAKS